MADRYARYLDHLGPTVPLRELHLQPGRTDAVALRHDVDHDLDTALEMAFWEWRRGNRASYFVLHSAPYWSDPLLVDKCLQLQDFGHEVGLHLNVLAEWMRGETDDVTARLHEILDPLREAGVHITGVSAHGDRLCYEQQLINYWCLAELRPGDPLTEESGLSAEGVPPNDARFAIQYPRDGVLRRDDGATFDLWSVPMAELGLAYHATHIPVDGYFSDSGGSWTRSPDPLDVDLATGRHQVLAHPEYWRAPQRLWLFLSTARVGSKWLATVLDRASSVTARHELTLNHRLETGTLAEDKRTGEGFVELQADAAASKRLALDARAWIETLPGDYAEANVYLAHTPEVLDEVFPDATFVHLHRDPRAVARSLLNRDWYDTPGDTRHPKIPVRGWERMSQLEKVCWYISDTTTGLAERCTGELRFAEMISDPDYLLEALAGKGIAFFPRLASPLFGEVVNANSVSDVPDFSRWQPEARATLERICGPAARLLGYDLDGSAAPSPTSTAPSRRSRPRRDRRTRVLLDVALPRRAPRRWQFVACAAERAATGLRITATGERHAHVMLGGSGWHETRRRSGWRSTIGHRYSGVVEASVEAGTQATVFCLFYGDDGRLLSKRALTRLDPARTEHEFAFTSRARATRFDLALYLPASDAPGDVTLRAVRLVAEPRAEPIVTG